ncbi:EVE domain-containing protein [Marinobacter salinexigens]|uniref:EVE domain-containing protein n=1 Tax=Marinobacter salinexigens TaxID=2919747 RepID=A0A5B0VMH9_9GAMM|nr:EVE domain-containing protein [Marinobacter salinexigens]KAA1175912.1 EVE domain-containing protein [Marinobacter salinexigens]
MAKWLVKSEPSECGIDDFAESPGKVIPWDGVRNYQARNFLAQMREGDDVFLYHSSCKHIGIAGIIRVVRSAYPDPTQFDPESHYYDPKSSPENPRWQAVDFTLERKLNQLMPLDQIKQLPGLESLPLVRRGNRLSVMPVSDDEWQIILSQT